MFCWGSKGSLTPREPAVSGMSCMRPCAPLDETAQGWKADSCSMAAGKRGAWISLALAAVSMRGAATASSMRSHGDEGDDGAEMADSSDPAMGGSSNQGSSQAPADWACWRTAARCFWMAARIRSAGGTAVGTETAAADRAVGVLAAGWVRPMQAIRILIHPICELIGWRGREL